MPSGIKAIFLPIAASCHSTLSALYSSPPLIRIAPITVWYRAVQEMLAGCWQGRRYTREPLGCRGLTAEIPPSLLAGGINIGIPAHSHWFAPDLHICFSLWDLQVFEKLKNSENGSEVFRHRCGNRWTTWFCFGFFCCCGFLVFVFHFHWKTSIML